MLIMTTMMSPKDPAEERQRVSARPGGVSAHAAALAAAATVKAKSCKHVMVGGGAEARWKVRSCTVGGATQEWGGVRSPRASHAVTSL